MAGALAVMGRDFGLPESRVAKVVEGDVGYEPAGGPVGPAPPQRPSIWDET